MTGTDCLFWDGDDQQPPDYVETHVAVVMILHMLDQACRGDDPAWCLDHALLCIANGSSGRHKDLIKLDGDDRDMILQGLTRAKALMPRFIPAYSARQFAMGLDAAMMQVILWAETEEERALRHPDTKADADDVARALRNDMHNWCLIDRVHERRHKRQAATISELIQPFRTTGIL